MALLKYAFEHELFSRIEARAAFVAMVAKDHKELCLAVSNGKVTSEYFEPFSLQRVAAADKAIVDLVDFLKELRMYYPLPQSLPQEAKPMTVPPTR